MDLAHPLSRHALPAQVALAALIAALLLWAPAAHAGTLRAGAGRADITPPTGFYMMGWVRSDAVMKGQNTRLFARVIVLERDGRKLALVAEDLNGIPGGIAALDRAFVHVQRQRGSTFRTVDTDLGLAMLWDVDDAGRYTARWEVPGTQPSGVYRFLITAKRYTLASQPFRVSPSRALTVASVGRSAKGVTIELRYPQAKENVDLTYRPPAATGGTVRAVVGGKPVTVRARKGTRLLIPAGAGVPVVIGRGAATDRDGNRNANTLTVGGGGR